MLHEYAELNGNMRVVYATPYLVELWDDILYPGNAPYQITESQASSIGIISDDDVPLRFILSLAGKVSSEKFLPVVRSVRLARVNTSEIEQCDTIMDKHESNACKTRIIGDYLLKIQKFEEILAYFPLEKREDRENYIENVFDGLRQHGTDNIF